MKTVILSFDDSRKDFYTNVFPLLKKYQIKATLNVISDFVVHPEGYSFPSGDDKAMTIDQVKECYDSELVEIACHGHTHLNTQKDVLDNIKQIKDEFGKEVELIIDDGDKKGGVPSTIVAIEENGEVKVIRQGAVKIGASMPWQEFSNENSCGFHLFSPRPCGSLLDNE